MQMSLVPTMKFLTFASFVGVSVKLRLALVTGQTLNTGMAIALTGIRVASVGSGSGRIASALSTSCPDVAESVLNKNPFELKHLNSKL
jgi:hypothetical protein